MEEGRRGVLQHKKIRLKDVLEGKPEADVELNPFDRLLVRRISNWRRNSLPLFRGNFFSRGSMPSGRERGCRH